ncbi:MAG: NAD(P)/FAD-dependent oxidoreductase [Oscillospiraceae bacterium]|nr:NAD(P)/FAD-dependent oxidoreductase [Oscillospiraceae bacterium]
MHTYDVIVIGGGLLGCFAARNLRRYNLKVALLEKREDLCTGISRANTAIVYSGCDNKSGSLKTTLCVSASQDFSRLCDELGVRYSKCGSIMISFGERGNEVLNKKFEQGIRNGVLGMKKLTNQEVLALEPNIAKDVYSGLFVPDTGTVMPWELCLAAAENAAQNGVEIKLNTEVLKINTIPAKATTLGRLPYVAYEITTNNETYLTKSIINCAGMSADSVLEMVSAPTVRIIPTAGDYIILDTIAAGHIKHVIFHEPEEKGKGLTLVPTVDGNILVGPTERKLVEVEKETKEKAKSQSHEERYEREAIPNSEFYATSGEGIEMLKELVSEVIPTLPMEQMINAFGAVRPNPYMLKQENNGSWVTEDRSVNDFCILKSNERTFISLVGVKTPGLTCSNELGVYLADEIAAELGATQNEHFDPKRKSPVRVSALDLEDKRSLIRKNPDYGNIICRCRGVSKGEILDAIHRVPGAVTLDGVKRRTGTDSGRCQGGFCTQRIVKILACELDCDLEEITKCGVGSNILTGEVRHDL